MATSKLNGIKTTTASGITNAGGRIATDISKDHIILSVEIDVWGYPIPILINTSQSWTIVVAASDLTPVTNTAVNATIRYI